MVKKSAKPAHSGESMGTESVDAEVAGGASEMDGVRDVGWKRSSVRA